MAQVLLNNRSLDNEPYVTILPVNDKNQGSRGSLGLLSPTGSMLLTWTVGLGRRESSQVVPTKAQRGDVSIYAYSEGGRGAVDRALSL